MFPVWIVADVPGPASLLPLTRFSRRSTRRSTWAASSAVCSAHELLRRVFVQRDDSKVITTRDRA